MFAKLMNRLQFSRTTTKDTRLPAAKKRRQSPALEVLEDRNLMSATPATLFVDFDGHTERTWTNQSWRDSASQIRPKTYNNVVTTAFDLDGDPTRRSQREVDVIGMAVARVAEMFAPFNLKVTAVDPGHYEQKQVLVIAVGATTNAASDGEMLITGNAPGICNFRAFFQAGVQNVGYVGSNFISDTTDAKIAEKIATTIAHEAGHGFGLYHQSTWDSAGNLTARYRLGDALTSPIMGNNMQLSQRHLWANGVTDFGPGNTQDELAMLGSLTNGFGYAEDNIGHSIQSATVWNPAESLLKRGVIVPKGENGFSLANATLKQSDFFAFTTTGGDLDVTVTVPEAGTLHAKLALLDSRGNAVSANQHDVLGATLSKQGLAAGTYYIEVASAGGYGDVGNFTISAHLTPAPQPTPTPSRPGIETGIRLDPNLPFDGNTYTVPAGLPFSVGVYSFSSTEFRGRLRFSTTDPAAVQPRDYTATAADNAPGVFTPYYFRKGFNDGFTLNTLGDQTVTVSDPLTGKVLDSFRVRVYADVTTLEIRASTATPRAGEPFSITVSARDQAGRLKQGYGGYVHFSSSEFGTLPTDYSFRLSDGGEHTFSGGATLYTLGKQTIQVTDAWRHIQATITVTVIPVPTTNPNLRSFSVSKPAETTVGAPFTITVTALDASGRTLTNYNGKIHFSTNDDLGVLPADYVFTAADRGVHTFSSGAVLYRPGLQAIRVTDAANAVTSPAFINVYAAAGMQFHISNPGTTTSGLPFDVTVTVLDGKGQLMLGYTGTVNFTSSDRNSVLPADYTFTVADHGVHTFRFGASLNTQGTQTLGVSDAVRGITSPNNAVVVAAAGPNDMGRIVDTLNQMSAAQAGTVLWTYDWNRMMDTMSRMSAARVGDILWTYDWTRLIATLNRMTAPRVGEVLWTYDWSRLIDTMNHMTAQRAGEVLWTYDWSRMIATLNRMTAQRAGEVLWSYDWSRLIDTLNHMTAKRASEVVWTYDSIRRNDTLMHMTSQRRTEVIQSLTN